MPKVRATDALVSSTARRNPLLARKIHRDVLDAIVEQRLLPGTHLREEQLVTIYGATRRQIAKVLQALATDELIELQTNRGAFVASPTRNEAHDIIELRRVVEAHIVRRLAGSPPLRARIDAALGTEHPKLAQLEHHAAVRHSGRFHVVLAECAGNREIAKLVRSLVARSSLVVELYGNRAGLACWIEEHAAILGHVAAGDRVGAGSAMEAHLKGLEASLIDDTPKTAGRSLSCVLGANL